MEINSIRDRAQGVADGPVSEAEVEFAREILRTQTGNIGAALYIVGYCGAPADAPLIETYLRNEEKDVYGDLALKALCRYLGLVVWYRDPIVKFVFADDDTDFYGSRLAGIQVASDYLKKRRDNVLESKLVSIFCDLQDKERGAARYALVEILGLRTVIADPLQLVDDAPDEDAPRIIEEACRQFGLSIGDHTREFSA